MNSKPQRNSGAAALAVPVHDAPSWAHASGWAQLSGSRQTVSCVMPCHNSARTLSKLLPILSDTLTECGYPWEVIVVDSGSTDGTDGLMQAWTELPGFRFLPIDGQAGMAAGFEAGILASRGDAVILLDPALHHSPELIPQMILQWESDARLVYAEHDGNPGHSTLRQWDDTQMRQNTTRPDFVLPPQCMELGLLDRRLVEWLLQAG
jgi:glycosyltransferase involved in cell wall biosynthesis